MSSITETEHALYMFTRTLKKYKKQSQIDLSIYADGLAFGQMLSSIKYFQPTIKQLEPACQKWTQKLTNLKKLINKMQSYVQNQSQKILKVNDVELVEIAKNSSQREILNFFQVVIAVLMQTPEKEDYIEAIMGLDERSQQALVIVVQNAMEYRILENDCKTNHDDELLQKLDHLSNQNHILNQQINQLCLQNEVLQKQNIEWKQKLSQYQQQLQKARSLNIQMYMSSQKQEPQQNSLVNILKDKLLTLTRQHEIELSKINEEIYQYKIKLNNSKEIEQELMDRNRFLETKIKTEIFDVQAERKRQDKIFQEKELKIRKLQYQLDISKNKIRQLSQDKQVNDLNLRIELQKKQIRFKQLQKQVKTRPLQLNIQQFTKNPVVTPQNQQQLQYLKIQVQKLRLSLQQLQRQNLKLKKRSQKIQFVENQKKKLEKIVLDVSKSREGEIQMLVTSLYDLRNQNVKMHQIIIQLRNQGK